MHNSLIKVFKQIVQIDSPTGSEDAMIEFLKKYFSTYPVTIYEDNAKNLIVTKEGINPPIMLAAHVDTVQPGEGIIPLIKDGTIYGSGNTILGADNKVAVAILMELIKVLSEKKITHRTIELVFTRSEEIGNLGAVSLDYSHINSLTALVFDRAAPVGTIVLGSPYYNAIDLTILGKAAHASMPDAGVNTLSIFTRAMNKLKLGMLSDHSIINIGKITAGQVRNTIPGELFLQAEVRSYKENELEQYTKQFIQIFEEEAVNVSGMVECTVTRENSGYLFTKDDSFVTLVREHMQKVGIKNIIFQTVWGCSDGNIFEENGIHTLNLGDGAYDTHTHNEHVAIADMKMLLKLIVHIISIV